MGLIRGGWVGEVKGMAFQLEVRVVSKERGWGWDFCVCNERVGPGKRMK